MIQLNPNFFKVILNVATKNFAQKISTNNFNLPNKNSSNINLGPMAKSNLKINATANLDRCSVIDDLKEGSSELHPFTFQQSQMINQATLNSNIHKLNLKMTERNENSGEFRVEANSVIEDSVLIKKFIEIKISSHKIAFMSYNGLTLVGVFNESTLSKMCKLILMHLYTSFMNSNFSESSKNGLTLMTKEDIIKVKIFEVIWLKLVISNFSNNLTKLINSQHKGYNSYELSNYYLVSVSRFNKFIANEPSSFKMNKNNYCVFVDIKKITSKPTIDYLKNELIFKELMFQGELLKNLFFKESGCSNEVYLDLSNQVSYP